jgi:hypothetical protein
MKVEHTRGMSSRIAIVIALAALILTSLFAAFEYAQVANLRSQNRTLSSIAASYNSDVANYTSSAGLVQSWTSHLTKLENLNTSSALEDYAPNATMVVSGAASIGGFSGLPGNYTGTNEIKNALDFFFGNTTHYQAYVHTQSAHVAIESFNVTGLSDGNSTIEADLALTGESRVFGAFNATISTSYQYTYQNTAWLISQEDWNFTYFDVQYPVHSQ